MGVVSQDGHHGVRAVNVSRARRDVGVCPEENAKCPEGAKGAQEGQGIFVRLRKREGMKSQS